MKKAIKICLAYQFKTMLELQNEAVLIRQLLRIFFRIKF